MEKYTKEIFIQKLNEVYPFMTFTYGDMNWLGHTPICANGIPLKCQWTEMMDEDLNSFYSINPEKEIESILFEYVGVELIHKILNEDLITKFMLVALKEIIEDRINIIIEKEKETKV